MRLQLRNTGADSCRFKVIQPPPGTGLKVVYKVGMVSRIQFFNLFIIYTQQTIIHIYIINLYLKCTQKQLEKIYSMLY